MLAYPSLWSRYIMELVNADLVLVEVSLPMWWWDPNGLKSKRRIASQSSFFVFLTPSTIRNFNKDRHICWTVGSSSVLFRSTTSRSCSWVASLCLFSWFFRSILEATQYVEQRSFWTYPSGHWLERESEWCRHQSCCQSNDHRYCCCWSTLCSTVHAGG